MCVWGASVSGVRVWGASVSGVWGASVSGVCMGSECLSVYREGVSLVCMYGERVSL